MYCSWVLNTSVLRSRVRPDNYDVLKLHLRQAQIWIITLHLIHHFVVPQRRGLVASSHISYSERVNFESRPEAGYPDRRTAQFSSVLLK